METAGSVEALERSLGIGPDGTDLLIRYIDLQLRLSRPALPGPVQTEKPTPTERTARLVMAETHSLRAFAAQVTQPTLGQLTSELSAARRQLEQAQQAASASEECGAAARQVAEAFARSAAFQYDNEQARRKEFWKMVLGTVIVAASGFICTGVLTPLIQHWLIR